VSKLEAIDSEGAVQTTPAESPERFGWFRRLTSSSLVLGLVSIALITVFWQLAVTIFPIKSYILPSPVEVGSTIVEQFWFQWKHALVTLREVLVGFSLAVVIGVPLAIAITFVPLFEKLFYPVLVATQAVPKVAVAPLFLVWFGFGEAPKVAMAALIAIFPIIIDTAVGLRAIDPDMVRLARSMRAGSVKTFWKVRLPMALPNVFAGFKMAMTFAVIGAVVGEFVAGTEGLGYLIQAAIGSLQTKTAFASIVLLSLMGILLFVVVEAFERVFVSWHSSMDSERH
jgi:NitT/TauT family transport system permease protein